MALWSLSVSDLKRRVNRTFLRISGESTVMHEDQLIINDAINRAIIDLSTDRGFDELKFIMSDATVTTVANQNWVDLDAGIIGVISGTIRIKAEPILLTRISLQQFTAFDVQEIGGDTPAAYAIDQGATADQIRLRLRPTPNRVLTIDLKVQTIPDEDSIGTVPGWMHSLLRSLATKIALEDLGFPVEAIPFKRSFDENITNAREQQRGDSGPQHVQMQREGFLGTDIQSRAQIS